MEIYQNQPLNNSCKTILLKLKNSIFISAFPGKIIFGTIAAQSYIKFKYFQFIAFELFHLYVSLVSIIKTVLSEENIQENHNGVILKINEELIYLWSISQSSINNQKQIHILLEFKSNLDYEIELNLDELNEFINGLSEVIIPCLNLKNIERQFFEFVSKQQISDIVQMTSSNSGTVLEQFKAATKFEVDSIIELNLIDIAIYYKELILIFKKIKSLNRPTDINSRIDAILSA
jgi:hypothetical protein